MKASLPACCQLSLGRPRGVALPLTLAYLVVLALVGKLVVEAAALQFHMAGNHESRALAEAAARAIAHELTQQVVLPLQLPPGYRACGATGSVYACDERTVSRPVLLDETGRDEVAYSIVRRLPATVGMMAGRENEQRVSSAAQDRFALYEVDVSVLAEDARPGAARIVRGIALRLPSATDR